MVDRTRTPAAGGFTLIEVMITVTIIAILAAIAIPAYGDYVTRGRIIDATTRLGDLRTDMEKYFMDNRTYAAGGACGVKPKIDAMNLDPSAAFTLTCAAPEPVTYTITADGVPGKGMAGFQYTIDQNNLHKTTALPSARGWSGAPKDCWIRRKDGTC